MSLLDKFDLKENIAYVLYSDCRNEIVEYWYDSFANAHYLKYDIENENYIKSEEMVNLVLIGEV